MAIIKQKGEETAYSFTHKTESSLLPNTIGSFYLTNKEAPNKEIVYPTKISRRKLPNIAGAYVITLDELTKNGVFFTPHRPSTLAVPPDIRDKVQNRLDIPPDYLAKELFDACDKLMKHGIHKAVIDSEARRFRPTSEKPNLTIFI